MKEKKINLPKNALSTIEASEYLGLSQATLRQSRMDGPRQNRCPVPPYVKIGRRIVYLKTDLDLFLQKLRVDPNTSQ